MYELIELRDSIVGEYAYNNSNNPDEENRLFELLNDEVSILIIESGLAKAKEYSDTDENIDYGQ